MSVSAGFNNYFNDAFFVKAIGTHFLIIPPVDWLTILRIKRGLC